MMMIIIIIIIIITINLLQFLNFLKYIYRKITTGYQRKRYVSIRTNVIIVIINTWRTACNQHYY